MKVAIIGSGLSGLSAASYLAECDSTEVTVLERDSQFGGRAAVTADGEHCPRFFLHDYKYLFAILSSIDRGDGRTVRQALANVQRYCHTETMGWVATSHLYRAFAREVPLVEKFRIARARMRSPLLAEQHVGQNSNRYSWRLSPATLARLSASLLRSKVAYTLEGPTDECLIDPWVAHLTRKSVAMRLNSHVTRLASSPAGVAVRSNGSVENYDAVIVTAFVPDAIELFDASGTDLALDRLAYLHCACFTVSLDPREAVVARGQHALYSRKGITVVVQPAAHRCVILCTKSPSTHPAFVLARLREMLHLEHEIVDAKLRDNQRPDEAILSADYVRPERLVGRLPRHVYLAGSYVKNSYPVDSAEGAARSAYNAVVRLQSDHNLRRLGAPR